jgi:23S rRNA-/tRNA-specific pseudouridylate synthase
LLGSRATDCITEQYLHFVSWHGNHHESSAAACSIVVARVIARYRTTCPCTSTANRSLTTTTTDNTHHEEASSLLLQVVQDDNPCWGSPTQCDLPHLLFKITKPLAISYESSTYIVLNKPPDLRMDGNYQATVHKLLTYWYPPKSLSLLLQKNDENETQLLDAILKVHQHNHLNDNELRPCHQLDYATSGVMLVARTQEAAAFAIQQWEDRKVQKSYLAVVQGRLDIHSIMEQKLLPTMAMDQVTSTLQRMEQAYRHSRHKQARKNPDTFAGFQPPHSLFHKYKPSLLQTQTTNHNNSKKKKRKRNNISQLLSEEQ